MIGKIIDIALALALAGLTGSLGLITYSLAQGDNWPAALVSGLACTVGLGAFIMAAHDIAQPKRW